ncbi:uncharacterized protein PAC_05864 [Phialocephala subalpina]|uniref:EthD domain-containing protein n=1 Tax=Phialocephala subalpina TaxID=576137 RepID=A0A1L7WT93_9HELO|nr:uncharacterized protein PAC_05864 [Phialocephala subalpina]
MSETIVTLLYPKSEKFDMNYYLTSHMPMAEKHFKSHGLTKYQVIQADPASGYATVCLLYFKDAKGADEGFKSAGDVLADVPNYTDSKLVSVGGKVVGGN